MTLFLGILFGAVGTVYLFIGRREHDALYLIVGFLLIIYPYIFSSALAIVAIGVLLSCVPIARAKGWI